MDCFGVVYNARERREKEKERVSSRSRESWRLERGRR
jgi:hypothetical protein